MRHLILPLLLLPAAAEATPWSKESWGVSLNLPSGWKSAEQNGVLLLGSDAEAGLILVRFLPTTSEDELRRGFANGVNEQGVQLSPMGEPQAFGAHGLAGELSGFGADGSSLRAYSVAMRSSFGGAAVVFGLTTEAHYAVIKQRTEALAKSVRFEQPRRPKGSALLAGRFEYIYVSPSGGYSREAKITLCADGRFSKGGEMAGSGAAGSAVTNHNNGGTWSAEGEGDAGQITLSYGNGQSEVLPYRISRDPRDQSGYGPAVVIGSTKYQRVGDCR
ncbi:MAG: hypothetical protein U1E65_30585 [Myxococcota bacterium]